MIQKFKYIIYSKISFGNNFMLDTMGIMQKLQKSKYVFLHSKLNGYTALVLLIIVM